MAIVNITIIKFDPTFASESTPQKSQTSWHAHVIQHANTIHSPPLASSEAEQLGFEIYSVERTWALRSIFIQTKYQRYPRLASVIHHGVSLRFFDNGNLETYALSFINGAQDTIGK